MISRLFSYCFLSISPNNIIPQPSFIFPHFCKSQDRKIFITQSLRYRYILIWKYELPNVMKTMLSDLHPHRPPLRLFFDTPTPLLYLMIPLPSK